MIYYVVFPFLLYEAVRDIKFGKVGLPGIIVFGVVCCMINVLVENRSVVWFIEGISVGVILLTFSHLTKEQIGYGDSMLFVALGLGIGLRDCVAVLFMALVTVCLTGGIICLIKKKNMKYRLPFIPFALLATVFLRIMQWRQ